MRHPLTSSRAKENIFKKKYVHYIKGIERTCLISFKFFRNKLAKLISSDGKKLFKIFF